MRYFWQLCLGVTLMLWQVEASHPNPPIVTTSSGIIIGHQAPYAPDVLEYLGIPYVQPPTRFDPAVPFLNPSTNVINASAFYPDCPQTPPKTAVYPNETSVYGPLLRNFTNQNGNAQSEDCLALNVWVKRTPGLKAVMIFFHGGRFSIGGSNSILYNGQYLSGAEDLIVVTINYRLNIFGFPGSSALPSQNLGLLDQRAAIEWVYTNIAAFGGDRNRITIFGQSAGGCSVDYYSYAYHNDTLVAGMISESGTAFSFAPNTPTTSDHYFNAVAYHVGCGNTTTTTPDTVLSCMREIPFTSILSAIPLITPLNPSKALASPLFHPTIDNKTVFSLETYTLLASTGSFSRTPYLAGNNDNEAGYYRTSALGQNRTLTSSQWDSFNAEAFTCPTLHAVSARAAAGVPVWRYRYFGDWTNLRLYPGSGAYHGSELTLLFGTTANVTGVEDEEREGRYGRYMQRAWASFAREPRTGLGERMGWPVYDGDDTKSLVRLAFNDSMGADFAEQGVYDGLCDEIGGDVSLGEGAF